ncbi:large conductance mechanosensitive channel protein MscL [Salinarimonas rosea]|uniref:large conductance mechanosensitive channel protein MscL n=1 Tax=Salinarimonas rosea TaxID=552063 RepID=UPI0004912C58|nr:large conductance mechanosensitive channel protein MscL [Salinarimonas rosea]
MVDEFRTFALKGNVVDLAVGVIIGAAFSRIVSSLVEDVFTPLIGVVTGGLDFSNYFLALSSEVTATTLAEAREQGAVIAYGSFVTATINFLIVAWVLFFVIRGINRLRARQEAEVAAPPEPPAEPEVPADVKLLAEIRDLLADGSEKNSRTGPQTH